jgi:hypothetical protein
MGEINELAAALAKAQAAINPAARESENPHLRSRYADLASVWEACRKALTDHGLSVVQMPEPLDGGVALRTTLLHTSGQSITGLLPLAFDPGKMQSLGSAITYARRYSLAAMVGVVSEEDDDGHQAQAPQRQERHAPPSDVNGHGDHYPSQGRPAPTDGGQGSAQRPDRGQHEGQHDRAPTNGKQLFAWCKKQEETHGVGLIRYLNQWSKLNDFPGRLVDFDAEQTRLAHAEAVRKLKNIVAGADQAYEEALAN